MIPYNLIVDGGWFKEQTASDSLSDKRKENSPFFMVGGTGCNNCSPLCDYTTVPLPIHLLINI